MCVSFRRSYCSIKLPLLSNTISSSMQMHPLEMRGSLRDARQWEDADDVKERARNWRRSGLVCRAQVGLKALGYNPGSLDGKEGSNTCRAAREFKSKRGIRGGCTINEALERSIEEEVDKASKVSIAPP